MNKNVCIRGNQRLIELLTPEGDWGFRLPGLPRLPRLPLAFFYGEKAFNNIKILLNSYIYHNFQKKNTRWVTAVTEVTRDLIARNPDQ